MKRIHLQILALAVVGGLLYVAYTSFSGGPLPPEVKTVAVDSGPIRAYVRATATVNSPSEVRVGSTITGRVEEVLVEAGNTVTGEQPLARLNSQEAARQLAIDELAVTKIDTSIAQQRRVLEVLRKDYAAGAEPLEKLTQAQESLAMDEVQRRQALANTALARLRVAESVVRAPIGGIVTEANIRPGQVVHSGEQLFTLTDLEQQQILARIEPGDAPDIRVGAFARVSLENAPEQAVDEKVLRIEPAIRKEGNTAFLPVWISLTHSALVVRPNQQLDVRLLVDERTAEHRLPLEALASSQRRSSAWIVQSGRLHAQPVTLGMIGDGYAEVLSGLQPGQLVVLPGGQTLKEGNPVRVGTTAQDKHD
jgi:RND family efflux transporter MFP subunit